MLIDLHSYNVIIRPIGLLIRPIGLLIDLVRLHRRHIGIRRERLRVGTSMGRCVNIRLVSNRRLHIINIIFNYIVINLRLGLH